LNDPALYGYFLIFDSNEYSVFLGERGGMHWMEKFTRFDDAAKYKIELVIDALRA
jgi:hypothetical protein